MKRDSAIEWLRVASAVGIVWFHTGVTGAYWGYAGLIIFLLMSIMFEAGPNAARPLSVLKVARRLLLPWAFWWVIYALLNIVRGDPIVDLTHGFLLGILAGPSVHLWYLPFMFCVLIAFGAVKGRLSTATLAVCAAIAAITLIVAIPQWKPASAALGAPIAQWTHACVPILLGILAGCGMRQGWTWMLAAPVAAVLAWACFQPFPQVATIYLLGFALVAGVLALPLELRQRAPDARLLFQAMLGVYLVHPLALALLRPLAARMDIAGPPLIFVTSALGVLAAQRVAPYASHLLLGTAMPAEHPNAWLRSRYLPRQRAR